MRAVDLQTELRLNYISQQVNNREWKLIFIIIDFLLIAVSLSLLDSF